jgi:hypothetical protein
MIDPFELRNRVTVAPTDARRRPRVKRRTPWALLGTSLDPAQNDEGPIGTPGLAAAFARCRRRLAGKLDLSAFKGHGNG